VWAFIALQRLAHRGESESDTIERLLRSHMLFVPE
jgi:hypothetical protein